MKDDLGIIVCRQEVTVGGKEIDVHAQDFVANDEFLLPTLTALVQGTRYLHSTRNA
jgi:hypothetical protein